jgi:hypothetical protein
MSNASREAPTSPTDRNHSGSRILLGSSPARGADERHVRDGPIRDHLPHPPSDGAPGHGPLRIHPLVNRQRRAGPSRRTPPPLCSMEARAHEASDASPSPSCSRHATYSSRNPSPKSNGSSALMLHGTPARDSRGWRATGATMAELKHRGGHASPATAHALSARDQGQGQRPGGCSRQAG